MGTRSKMIFTRWDFTKSNAATIKPYMGKYAAHTRFFRNYWGCGGGRGNGTIFRAVPITSNPLKTHTR